MSSTFSDELNSFSCLILWLVLGLIFGVQIFLFGQKDKVSEVGGTDSMRSWYIPFFLLKLSLFSFFFSVGITQCFNLIVFVIAILFILSFIFLIFKPPYLGSFSNIAVIFNQGISIYAISLAIVNKYLTMDKNTEIFMLFILEGLICLALVFACVRVLIFYCKLCRKKTISAEQQEMRDEKALITASLLKRKGKSVFQSPTIFKKSNPYSILPYNNPVMRQYFSKR